MSYAFVFDARYCSGCKACQEACKDKNELPVGVLWRRVIEVSGGEWQRTGQAWENSVFAYNLSLACNHCVHPKCAGVCPADAYTVRPDGIVLLDSSRCMGCGYCAWACPYGAPQYVPGQGVMTKCNFCYEELDAGQLPACVAACPLRVLDCATTGDPPGQEGVRPLWQIPATEHPFPLPEYSRTEPHLAIRPHPAMGLPLEKSVSNREEIQPGESRRVGWRAAFDELPLVAFTLLAQMAAGMTVAMLALPDLPLPPLLAIGALLGTGGLFSFLHLGRKRNAWRAMAHLGKSWLSREVLAAGLFGAAWAVTAGLAWLQQASIAPWIMALLGLVLVYSMARVYRLGAVPAWNTWRTPATFFLSTATLGAVGMNLFQPDRVWASIAGLALATELALALTKGKAGRLSGALPGLGTLAALAALLFPQAAAHLALPLLLATLAAEVVGRIQFYAARQQPRGSGDPGIHSPN